MIHPSVQTGGTPARLAFRRRREKPVRLVALLGASGSISGELPAAASVGRRVQPEPCAVGVTGKLVCIMFCATILVAGQCALACSGELDEFRKAWHIRWDNGAQAVVDDHGPVPQLRRVKGEAVWTVEAEQASCIPVPEFKPRTQVATAEPKP